MSKVKKVKRTRPMTISSESGKTLKKGSEVDKTKTVTMQVSTGYEKRLLKKMRGKVEGLLSGQFMEHERASVLKEILTGINDLLGEKPVDFPEIETEEIGDWSEPQKPGAIAGEVVPDEKPYQDKDWRKYDDGRREEAGQREENWEVKGGE